MITPTSMLQSSCYDEGHQLDLEMGAASSGNKNGLGNNGIMDQIRSVRE